MITTLIILVALSVPSYEQDAESVPISPCPDVFQYEPSAEEESPVEKRWYGVIKLAPRVTIQSVTLHIILDSKADILGNWLGETSSKDNINFKIDNKTIVVEPGAPTTIRFFVQYSPLALAPKIKIILLNDKEICNADRVQPAIEGTEQPFVEEPVSREPRPSLAEIMQRWPIKNKQNYDGIVPMTSSNLLSYDSNINRDGSSQSLSSGRQWPDRSNDGYPVNRNPCRSATETLQVFQNPSIDDDYFDGGPSPVQTPCTPEQTNRNRYPRQDQCGMVALKSIPLIINGTPTMEGQWPWQIALYHSMGINYVYRCGGTLVSLRHVVTAAHCVTRMSPGSFQEFNPTTLFVILGKHNLRTSVNGVHRYVSKVTVHPDYNKVLKSTDESTFSRDLAILELREPVTYNDVVRPVCLWPENLVDIETVIGQRGSVVGWGVDASGEATEELKLAEIPVVDELTCVKSNEFFLRFASSYTYCAGARRGSSVCVGDSGSGMVFQISGIWYLRGLVSVAVASHEKYRCDPRHYTVFTDLAKFLPWIKQNIYDG